MGKNGDFSLKGRLKASKMAATSIVDKPAQIGTPETHRAESNTPGLQMKQVRKFCEYEPAVRYLILLTSTLMPPQAHHQR